MISRHVAVSQRDWVAYVGPFLFPWGQAASRRMVGISRSLSEAGYDVVVAAGGHTPKDESNLDEGERSGSIRYLGIGELSKPEMSTLRKIWRVCFEWGARTIEWLEQQPRKPSHVIVYGGGPQYMLRLLKWCRRNDIPLIVDVVEWYDPRQLEGGRFGPLYIGSQIALRILYPRSDGIIAISSLLEGHYRKLGCNVIRIPPTLAVRKSQATSIHGMPEQPLTLLYAGSPGRKDLLVNVIDAMRIYDPVGKKLRLKVLGPTVEDLMALYGCSDLPESVEVLGRLNQFDIADHISTADFTVLLREPALAANAGFPTKFVESMANGTPVISNLTSDIGMYLYDGINGLICDDWSTASLLLTFGRAVGLSRDDRIAMKQAATLEASRSFDFSVYTQSLGTFLADIG